MHLPCGQVRPTSKSRFYSLPTVEIPTKMSSLKLLSSSSGQAAGIKVRDRARCHPPRVQTEVLLYELLAKRAAVYVHFLTWALPLCPQGKFHLSESWALLSTASGARRPAFWTQFYHQHILWSWESHFTFLQITVIIIGTKLPPCVLSPLIRQPCKASLPPFHR